jgi:hypothetical protein
MTWTPPPTDEDPGAQPCRTGFVTRPGTIHGVRWAAAKDAELYSGKQFILATADQHTRSLGVMSLAESVRTSHSSAGSGVVTSVAYHRAWLSIGKSWARKGTPALCVVPWPSCFDFRGQ